MLCGNDWQNRHLQAIRNDLIPPDSLRPHTQLLRVLQYPEYRGSKGNYPKVPRFLLFIINHVKITLGNIHSYHLSYYRCDTYIHKALLHVCQSNKKHRCWNLSWNTRKHIESLNVCLLTKFDKCICCTVYKEWVWRTINLLLRQYLFILSVQIN